MNRYIPIIVTLAFNILGGYYAKLSAISLAQNTSIKYTLIAIACYGMGFLSYVVALRFIPLFIAQSILSTQYVAVILLSILVFNETISPTQGIGIVLVFSGLILLLMK